MPLWLIILLLLVLTFWLGRCFLAIVERGRCGGLCAVPLVVFLLAFSDLPDMAVWFADIGQELFESIASPDGFLGTVVLAAGIFMVVFASLHLTVYLVRRSRREKQRPAPPADASGPFTVPGEDWNQLLKRADERSGGAGDGVDESGMGSGDVD